MAVGKTVLEHGIHYAHFVVPVREGIALGLVPYIDVPASRAGDYRKAVAFPFGEEQGEGRHGHVGDMVAVVNLVAAKAVVRRSAVGPYFEHEVGNRIADSSLRLRMKGRGCGKHAEA